MSGRFIPTADLVVGQATTMGVVTAIRRTAKTTFITCGQVTYPQATATNIFIVPVHLLPSSCHVCGAVEGTDHSGNQTHEFWSNADADAHFAAEDAASRGVQYSDGTTTPEAHYVASVRPY